MALSLEKKSELVRLNLAKRQVPTDIKIAVKAVIDVSGSMRHFFDDGTMQELFDRLIPVGMRFDDNQSLEAFAFSDTVKKVSDIRVADFGSYVSKFLSEARRGPLWGGTKYSQALEAVLEDLNPKKTWGQMFGLGKPQAIKPSYIKFITDGDTMGDQDATERLLEKLGNFKCYVQLIGIGHGSSFGDLQMWAKEFDHVGFVTFPDLENTSDQQMYEQLLSVEFCNWIKQQ